MNEGGWCCMYLINVEIGTRVRKKPLFWQICKDRIDRALSRFGLLVNLFLVA